MDEIIDNVMGEFLFSESEFNITSIDTDDISEENIDVDLISDPPSYINNFDYTLNSPLISDEIDAFIKFLQTGSKPKWINTRYWENRKSWISDISFNRSINGSKTFHKNFINILNQKTTDISLIKKIAEKTNEDSIQTGDVIVACFKKWLNKRIVIKQRENIPKEILRLGQLMLEFHYIVSILNATSIKEQNSLKKLTKIKKTLTNNNVSYFCYNSNNLDEVHIGNHYVWFKKWNQLCDRNMVLLIKDSLVARFQTLLAIKYREYEYELNNEHVSKMIELYKLGDVVIKNNAVDGYKVISFLEAVSSNKLSLLAREYRRLIPEFRTFQNHINMTMEEFKNIDGAYEFLKYVGSCDDKTLLIIYYGCFRHWGHPFINYKEGLLKLHDNVTKDKNVNDEYSQMLASDLAFKVIKNVFDSMRYWPIDIDQVNKKHILYKYIKGNTWPNPVSIQIFGDKWHSLPIIKCFDIPDVMDPSQIYSDKTHSINRDELIEHIRSKPNCPIPTRKVLETLLKRPATDWKLFIKKINDHGLEREHLIIGLKPKERENKPMGRFFTLMSWELREYFVFTEYLIKQKFIPLFKGLTMADDQNTVIKKMLDCTQGQGSNNYEQITIANHLDYEKWNNYQTYDGTKHVFTVMGQFYGHKNLFSRSHEFFEKSLVYYKDRPDLLCYNELIDDVDNNSDDLMCWHGQNGGFEGIRQKGWTVLGYLIIEREGRFKNVAIKVLAQGDNQVICTLYKLRSYKTDDEIRTHTQEVLRDNEDIMNKIRSGSAKLGLKINEDETLQSADMLIYGKNIIYRGNLLCLREKRYSRVSCVTNDQLPNYANTLSTLTTNCLTVAHFSPISVDSIIQYNWLGNFLRNVLELHNPALRCAPIDCLKEDKKELLDGYGYKIASIYLDPSLGGIGGMSVTRYMIRMFPDPICESLSFWKGIYEGTDKKDLKDLCIIFGNPNLLKPKLSNFNKLLENPESLNLPRGISATHLLQNEIKKAMLNSAESIKNDLIRDSLIFEKQEGERFNDFLLSIKPVFPRFLSEYRSGTFHGITDGLIGLFQNSKTIRNIFSRRFSKRVDETILHSELTALNILISFSDTKSMKYKNKLKNGIWLCSVEHSDDLRLCSWGCFLIGTTIPHPFEMISNFVICMGDCDICHTSDIKKRKIIVIIPDKFGDYMNERGKYAPYMGSSTKESTSILQPWERETRIPVIQRATRLRTGIDWFIDRNGPLAKSIYNNIKSLTGEDVTKLTVDGYKRTGSYPHRWSCTRVSDGGFSANSPVLATRMIVSSDDYVNFGSTNYTFMHQSLMVYAQQTAGLLHLGQDCGRTYHFHISCKRCIKVVDEPMLTSDYAYEFPDMSFILNQWKPSDVPWFEEKIQLSIKNGKWDDLNIYEKSYQVGMCQGYFYSEIISGSYPKSLLSDLFPISIRSKLNGFGYFKGIIKGINISASCYLLHRNTFFVQKNHIDMIKGTMLWIIKSISKDDYFLNIMRSDSLMQLLHSIPHKIPPSYPSNQTDLGSMAQNYFELIVKNDFNLLHQAKHYPNYIYIFADFLNLDYSGPYIIGNKIAKMMNVKKLTRKLYGNIKAVLDVSISSRNNKISSQDFLKMSQNIEYYSCDSEVRHAVKSSSLIDFEYDGSSWNNERDCIFGVEYKNIPHVLIINMDIRTKTLKNYKNTLESVNCNNGNEIIVPTYQNPTISGLRVPQLATGSQLKIQELFDIIGHVSGDILCGGDGSGGITAAVLRKYPGSRAIFNSLIEISGMNLKGSLPTPPAAIYHMASCYKSRCINLNNTWDTPSDLSSSSTWDSFNLMIRENNLNVSLMIFDMEIRNDEMIDKIESNIEKYMGIIFDKSGIIVYKTYCDRIINKYSIIDKLSSYFQITMITLPQISSSQTSEIYVIFKHYRNRDNIRLYPIKSEIVDWLKCNSYCFNTRDSEFERALFIHSIDTAVGVPNRYIMDHYLELQNAMLNLNCNSSLVSEWITTLRSIKSDELINDSSVIIATVTLISTSIIPTLRALIVRPELPSDQKTIELISFLFGSMIFVSILFKNYELNEWLINKLNSSINVYFKRKYNYVSRKWSIIWSLHEMGGSCEYKTIYISSKMASIGNYIRIWRKIYGPIHTKKLNMLKVCDYLSKIHKNFDINKIKNETGVLEPLAYILN